MTKATFIFALQMIIVSLGCAQISPERAAQTRMERGKWAAAKQSLEKAVIKDSASTEAKFLYAQFYFNQSNPAYNIDSAYRFTLESLKAFAVSSDRQKERLARIPIDSSVLILFRSKIDSVAFAKAKQLNTESAYNEFLTRYSFASERVQAIELRNEVAYLDALRANSVESFKEYIGKYPESRRAAEAADRYEQLLYDERTADKKLVSYKKFLLDFPHSKFRKEVEEKIFEITTASGRLEDYEAFVNEFPSSSKRSKAINIAYYLIRDKRPSFLSTDSLKILDDLNKGYWVPFYKNNRYGFMNDRGDEVIAPHFSDISSDYLCGNIDDDFLLTSDGLFARTGARLFEGTPDKAEHLGFGFIKITRDDCVSVVHKSGFMAGGNCIEDGKIIADRFLVVKEKKLWGLFAFNGLRLLPARYQDITSIDNTIVLSRMGKKILVKPEQVEALADQNPLDDHLVFDEVRAWGEGNLHVRNGSLEGVINQDLEFIIPFDRHNLTKTSFGFIQEKDARLRLVGVASEVEGQSFDRIKNYGEWIELYQVPRLLLYQVPLKRTVGTDLDSIWMQNKMAFAEKGDSILIFGRSGKLASFARSAPVQFIKSRDTLVYFFIPEKNRKIVYEAATGKILFVTDFDEIESPGKGIFIFSKNKKKGILSKDGKILLPPQYDIIVFSSNGFLSLLKDKKFGLYDIEKRILIKTEYERNVLPYSPDCYIAFKGVYGFISSKEEPLSEFEFDEIRYWNDTSALVKKGLQWSVYSIKERARKLERIRNFEIIKNTAAETLLKVQRDNYYGVVSNRKGIIIPPSFTDILNLGSEEKPLYFTEKRVEEADIYVVIYYNHEGKFMRKQVYEAEEYEKIYCDEN